MFKRRRNRQRQNSSNGTLTGSDAGPGSVGSGSTSTARNGKQVHPTTQSLPGSASSNHSKSPKPLLKNRHGGGGGNGESSHTDSEGGKVSGPSLGSLTASTRSSTAVKHVRFSNVEIRQYERVLGSNPSCSSGAPVGIGWGYNSADMIELDDYESQKPKRKTQVELVLSRQEREQILLEWGASFHEIVEAIRNNIRIKNQRRHTVNTLGRYDKWEEMMEKAGRKFKRTILLQKTTGQRAKELSEQVQPAVLVLEAHEGSEESKEEIGGTLQIPAQLPADVQEHRHHHHHHHHHHAMGAIPQQLSQKSMLSEQHPASAAEAAANLEQQQLAVVGLAGLGEQKAAPLRRQSYESMSLDGDGARHGLPLLEVDVFDVADVSSRISYDEEMTIYTDIHGEDLEGDDVDYDDDGFGLLIRDTRHWYVEGDGSEGPQVQRRITPLVISEDYNVYEQPPLHPQQQQFSQPYSPYHEQQPPYPNAYPYTQLHPADQFSQHQQQPNAPPQHVVVMTEQQWLYQGYSMQPPPYSQAMTVHWE